MYYLYKKSKSTELPDFSYSFGSFEEFYEVAKLLEVLVVGSYYIRVKTDSYADIMNFIEVSDSYPMLVVYVEISETLLNYILLQKPNASMLESKSNYAVFEELISNYGILFDKGCVEKLYFAIGHSYSEMNEALDLILQTYPDKRLIGKEEIQKLFVLDTLTYPRSVLIQYLRMDRGRRRSLKKSIDYFGNDIVFYSMRKQALKFLEDKINYLQSGMGNGLIKSIPVMNIVRMVNCLSYSNSKFRDISTILDLYEKGETINDTLQERTLSASDEEHYSFG